MAKKYLSLEGLAEYDALIKAMIGALQEELDNHSHSGFDIATDDEIVEMLAQEDMLPVVTDTDGSILADENENILLW
jgi:hypothetical protein